MYWRSYGAGHPCLACRGPGRAAALLPVIVPADHLRPLRQGPHARPLTVTLAGLKLMGGSVVPEFNRALLNRTVAALPHENADAVALNTAAISAALVAFCCSKLFARWCRRRSRCFSDGLIEKIAEARDAVVRFGEQGID